LNRSAVHSNQADKSGLRLADFLLPRAAHFVRTLIKRDICCPQNTGSTDLIIASAARRQSGCGIGFISRSEGHRLSLADRDGAVAEMRHAATEHYCRLSFRVEILPRVFTLNGNRGPELPTHDHCVSRMRRFRGDESSFWRRCAFAE